MKIKIMSWMLVFLLMTSLVLGLGIRPAKTITTYSVTNSKDSLGHFQFKVVNELHNQSRMAVSLYPSGEIKDLIFLPIEKIYFDDSETVVDFYINYSKPIETGTHYGEIVVEQIPDASRQISTQVILKHKITLNVVKGITFLDSPSEYIKDKLKKVINETINSNNPIIVFVSYSFILAILFAILLIIYLYFVRKIIKKIYPKKHKK